MWIKIPSKKEPEKQGLQIYKHILKHLENVTFQSPYSYHLSSP